MMYGEYAYCIVSIIMLYAEYKYTVVVAAPLSVLCLQVAVSIIMLYKHHAEYPYSSRCGSSS